jgi:hypothetical protein
VCSEPLVPRFRAVLLTVALVLIAGASHAAAQSTGPGTPSCPRPVAFEADEFPGTPVIDNRWLPFTPGTQLTLEGRANRGGGPLPHTVTFTVTDLTKVIDGVRTVVVWDVDVNEGELAETELAFFAQDLDGNVWNLGEYPEEFEGGTFAGAPSTWIAGMAEAEAGLHMLDFPFTGDSWLQGFAPQIDFLDCAEVVSKIEPVDVPAGSFSRTLLTRETSPLDPSGGAQLKYHAAGVGIVQVGAENDPEGETLVLKRVEQLSPEVLAAARNEALLLDARGYVVSEIYAQTEDMELPPGVVRPSLPADGPSVTPATGGTAGLVTGLPADAVPAGPGAEAAQDEIDPDDYTAKVDHPLVPLSSVPFTSFRGREEGTRIRVVSRVLKRKRRVAGVRVTIVAVREYEDGELVERTQDYFAEDRQGRVWYFGETVDDIEDGRVVGHEGQWFAGRDGALPGLFMPAKPRVGQRFEQERAPGVAEDRSKVVRLNVEVTTPAGEFDKCIKTRDFAPLDNATEFKFYCPGIGLVREQASDARLALARYRRSP